jgi:hypothetical protein
MSIIKIKAPDLSGLSIGGATILLMEAITFTADNRHVLVKTTYLDDGTEGNEFRYGYFLYDIASGQYVENINLSILGPARAQSSSIEQMSFTGTVDNYSAVTVIDDVDSPTDRISIYENGSVTNENLLSELFNADVEVTIEKIAVGDEKRFIAIQTSDGNLAPDADPDTNDSPDIYLIDTLLSQITRVSFVGGAGVTEPTYLQDIRVDSSQVQITFSTDAAYVSPSRIDTNSSELTGPIGSRTDAYIWTALYDYDGIDKLSVDFGLISQALDGQAGGFVNGEQPVIITDSGVYFSSASEQLISDDDNSKVDSFISIDGVSKAYDFLVDQDTVITSTNEKGQYVGLLSSSSQFSGTTGAQQMVFLNLDDNSTRVASVNANGEEGNNETISGVFSPSGKRVAFTSLATNLTQDDSITFGGSGDLYLVEFEDINSVAYSDLTLDTLPLPGNTVALVTDSIVDIDGLGAFSYQWYLDGELVENETLQTFAIENDDVGKSLSASISFVDGNNFTEQVFLEPINVVSRPIDANGGLAFTTKYIIIESEGQNLFNFDLGFDELTQFGQAYLFSGSSAVDMVAIKPGQVLDFTNAKAGVDKVFMPWDLEEYLNSATIDNATGVMTLVTNRFEQYTELKFIATNTDADEIIFANGMVSSTQLKNYLLSSDKDSFAFDIDLNQSSDEIPNIGEGGSVKAISLDGAGEVFKSISPDVSMQVSGSNGVDQIYVLPGTEVDASNLKAGIDIIYFQGQWSDYDKSIDSATGNLQISRLIEVNGKSETEIVLVASGSILATNDQLVFADGGIRIIDAINAVKTQNNGPFYLISGFDEDIVTPTIDDAIEPLFVTNKQDKSQTHSSSNIELQIGLEDMFIQDHLFPDYFQPSSKIEMATSDHIEDIHSENYLFDTEQYSVF